MAKGKGQRPLPSTPGPQGRGPGPESQASSPETTAQDAQTPSPRAPSRARESARAERAVEPYLISGTKCRAGHEPGLELDAGPIGTVPARRSAWFGFALVLWCGIGLAFVLAPRWITVGFLVAVAWLVFSAFVQRRLGHRGKCWRTRAWRQAWGGLVPGRD